MRRKLIKADIIDCVLGLGPSLFYNSPMEACVVVCRTQKPPERRDQVLLIHAVEEVTRERAQSFLEREHIERIVGAYQDFRDVEGLARIATLDEIRANQANLSIPLYVLPVGNGNGKGAVGKPLPKVISEWQASSRRLRQSMDGLSATVAEVVAE